MGEKGQDHEATLAMLAMDPELAAQSMANLRAEVERLREELGYFKTVSTVKREEALREIATRAGIDSTHSGRPLSELDCRRIAKAALDV